MAGIKAVSNSGLGFGAYPPFPAGHEIAYAENDSGTPYTVTTNYAAIPGCSIVVPAMSQPYFIHGYVNLTVAGPSAANGIIALACVELFGADSSELYQGYSIQVVPTPGGSNYNGPMEFKWRVNPSPVERTFALEINKGTAAGFTVTVNNGNNFRVFKSWIGAYAA